MVDLVIRNGRLSDGTRGCTVAIDRGAIVAIGPGLDLAAVQVLDARDGLIIPGFVESHMHLDVALMNDAERPGRPAPPGGPRRSECRRSSTEAWRSVVLRSRAPTSRIGPHAP